MLNKKYAAICVFATLFVLYAIYAFAERGTTYYIFQLHNRMGALQERLIPIEDGMDLSGERLPGIFIHRNNMHGRERGTLRDVDFSGSSLIRSDLSETHFVNCSFKGANLAYATAWSATFEDCDFTGAEIAQSNVALSKEQLITTGSYKHKDLKGYNFQGAGGDFSGVDFSGFDLSGANFNSTDVKKNDFSGCNFSNAKISATAQVHSIPPKTAIWNRLTREQLLSTKCFRQRSVINVVFGGDLSEMDFSGMNLTGCLIGGNFHNADFTNSVITDCDFRFGSNNLTFEQIKSTWNYKTGNMAGIILPKELQEQLDAERQAEEKKP